MVIDTKNQDNAVVSSQLRGETMAYAIQGGLYNLGANFFEPYINYRFQKHFAADREHVGNYSQNFVGEIAGDVIGASTLMAAEAFAPEQLHYFTRTMRKAVDPIYETAARYALMKKCNEPDFEQQVKDWKVFQERNLIRSGIMLTAGIGGNIATQKFIMKNPAPTMLILEGKLISSTITTALGLAARFMFPEKLEKVDTWMGKKIAPFMEAKEIDAEPSSDVKQLDSITGAKLQLQL